MYKYMTSVKKYVVAQWHPHKMRAAFMDSRKLLKT